jgi:hypothetical protein
VITAGLSMLTICLCQAPPPGASGAPPANKRQAEVARLAQRAIQEQQFSSSNSGARLSPHSEPILRWSNPTVGEVYGDVYVWTDRGRPSLVGSMYRFFQPNWGATFEVCSLSSTALSGRTGDREFWHPAASGLKWQALADAAAPAATSAGRLSQIRRLATEFSATVIDTRNVDTPVPRILRLMTQPLFRYPAPVDGSDYMDGALFTFVEGTDPEVMLLIEATRSDGVPAWRFGLARMNGDELRVSHRDQPVWQVPRVSWQEVRQHPHVPYCLFVLDAESGRVKP